MPIEWSNALLGGVVIGLAVSVMLLLKGRVTGISGIISGIIDSALASVKGDVLWRVFFLGGLISGGFIMGEIKPEVFSGQLTSASWTVVVAGLLVGFGAVMGSGCTSGHGVCGISRLSPRSLLATMVFMIAGIAAVFIFKRLVVL